MLELLALGKTNLEIARDLATSAYTVKRHVENTLKKLRVSGRTQAVVRALEQGIIPFPQALPNGPRAHGPLGNTLGDGT